VKVVHVIEALGGGVYTYFKDLSYFFGDSGKAQGIETYIIYSGNRKEIDPGKIKEAFSPNVTLIEIPMKKEISPLDDIKGTFKLYKALKKLNPDVIHLHSSKAGVLGRIAHFFLFNKKKLFYTPHGYYFLRTDISKTKQTIYRLIEKYSQVIFGGTTIACGDTEYYIAKSMGKAALIRNGIIVPESNVYKAPTTGTRLKVGIIGRITCAKAPTMFNEIALKFPDFDFIWIGDGEMRNVLTATNISITGWFHEASKVSQYLDTLDIYLQTSLWEGLPIAVLEAMALQKPVVATNVIGNKDIVIHNKTGFLFDSVSELDDYFETLNDEATRRSFGINGYERCKAVFNIDTNFKELAALYLQ